MVENGSCDFPAAAPSTVAVSAGSSDTIGTPRVGGSKPLPLALLIILPKIGFPSWSPLSDTSAGDIPGNLVLNQCPRSARDGRAWPLVALCWVAKKVLPLAAEWNQISLMGPMGLVQS